MCIAYLAIRPHSDWPLFIAANRDEFHARPTLAAAPWKDCPDVIAGIDMTARGTWLGVTRQGRYALLTNYRDPGSHRPDAASRGGLVAQYLAGAVDPQAYAGQVAGEAAQYNGFNLIVGDLDGACYVSNRGDGEQACMLGAGRYVLSNHLLDTAWPKTQRLRAALDRYPLDRLDGSVTPVFDILRDTTQAEDAALPRTGLALERERLLSSPFIVSPDYGTRCSTVIAVHADGHALFSEVSYDAQGRAARRHDWPFRVAQPGGRPWPPHPRCVSGSIA